MKIELDNIIHIHTWGKVYLGNVQLTLDVTFSQLHIHQSSC